MFRQNRAILRELVTNTLPSYTSISNAAWQGIGYKLPEDDAIVSKHVRVSYGSSL